jgi:hypothetical protein
MSIRTHDRTLRTLVPVASIIEGDRVRADYGNLQELADSIASEGLIHPPVIDLTYRLIAGGRRFRAMRDILKLTEIEVNFFETVDDATLRRLEAEENVKRKEMTWQELVRSVKLVHQHQAISKASKGEAWTQGMTGKLLNRSQAHGSYALQIATLIDSNDDAITKCASLTDAIKLLIKRAEDTAMAQLARSTLGPSSKPTSVDILTADSVDIFTASSSGPSVGLASRPDAVELPQDATLPAAITIPLSSMCICADAIAWMDSQPAASFDHIITDPPYGIDMDNIQQSGGGMNIDSTRAEHNVTSNESLLQSFFTPAYRILRDRSFLILWCDQSQWSLLDESATLAGFAVQRWPILWIKTHPCQNMAAQYNFTKNYEIAMVCRKGPATLVSPQTSAFWQGGIGTEKDQLGHPFTKPANLWKWLYGAVAIRGQRVLDPFAGSGSSTVAAVSVGLQPTAIELNAAHHNRLIVNVSAAYRSMHPNITFT